MVWPQIYGTHPWLAKELADVIVKLFSAILKVIAMERIHEGWKKANVLPVFKKDKKNGGNDKTVSITLTSGKVIEQIILEIVSKHEQEGD